jgi:uncharacterized protein (DUF2235 family)
MKEIATPRNLIVCCDGTNNEFGPENTNVVRLIQALDRTPGHQRIYYDPGVGTLPEPGFVTRVGKKLSDLGGLAFGAGLTWKVQEAYTYLMNVWEPGDKVYLIGFSRGAYTVRVLAGLLHTLGLLPRGGDNLVPYVMRLYAGARDERKEQDGDDQWRALCDTFRWTFSRQMVADDDDRRFKTHFLGVWDTVSSVGWVWDPAKYPSTANNPSIETVRHAVSVDERRWFFRQNLMKQAAPEQDWKEHWFPGVHCDVGGGYPPQLGKAYAELWRVPFAWMMEEAKSKGLLVDEARLARVLARNPASAVPWEEAQHESLTGPWWLAEVFPKRVWSSVRQRLQWEFGLGQHRTIPKGASIDKSTLLRVQGSTYSPPNFNPAFITHIKGLMEVPDFLPFF